MTFLELVNVSKRYGRTVAVDRVNLGVEKGEFVVLLGPSGCGKTTTLRIIAGLVYPDEGKVIIDGRDVTYVEPGERDVSMVFQDYALYPHMTVFDNIAFPLVVRRKKFRLSKEEISERVHKVAKMLGIDDLLDRKPLQLSGGQQQRVALARALIAEPKLWLMDEPLSNLDALIRVHLRAELKKLQKDLGITTIYVTHDQVEALTLADRIAVMNKGRIVQIGTPKEIYENPEHVFVATFVGSPPMNVV
ncbi:MAG: ABC transporter ATP-binding protein, partial [Desulfurococcaceae archaeon]